MNDEWFADEERVRRIVGLLEDPIPLPDAKEVTEFFMQSQSFNHSRLKKFLWLGLIFWELIFNWSP